MKNLDMLIKLFSRKKECEKRSEKKNAEDNRLSISQIEGKFSEIKIYVTGAKKHIALLYSESFKNETTPEQYQGLIFGYYLKMLIGHPLGRDYGIKRINMDDLLINSLTNEENRAAGFLEGFWNPCLYRGLLGKAYDLYSEGHDEGAKKHKEIYKILENSFREDIPIKVTSKEAFDIYQHHKN